MFYEQSSNPKKAVYFSNKIKINSFDVDVITTSRKVLYKVLLKNILLMVGRFYLIISLVIYA